jgi:hypothetical protein
VHQAPDVIAVVGDSKLTGDHFGDARGGPHVGVVAVCQRPFQQQSQQTALLGWL